MNIYSHAAAVAGAVAAATAATFSPSLSHLHRIEAGTNLVYIMKVGEKRGVMTLKVGASQNVHQRRRNIKHEFHMKQLPMILHTFEADCNVQFEHKLHTSEQLRPFKVALTTRSGALSRETYAMTKDDYHKSFCLW
jgi:hypothetical protein